MAATLYNALQMNLIAANAENYISRIDAVLAEQTAQTQDKIIGYKLCDSCEKKAFYYAEVSYPKGVVVAALCSDCVNNYEMLLKHRADGKIYNTSELNVGEAHAQITVKEDEK